MRSVCAPLYFDMLIFFFKQKTAYEMRISDWSSDVCSSDLIRPRDLGTGQQHPQHRLYLFLCRAAGADDRLLDQPRRIFADRQPGARAAEQHDAAGVREL